MFKTVISKLRNFTKSEISKKMSPNTLKIFERLESEHPNIFRISLDLIFLLAVTVLIKLIYIIQKYSIPFFSDKLHLEFEDIHIEEIEHIDLAGVICGILGIIIAFLITLYVEKDHQEESKELKNATDYIQLTAEKILQRFTSFVTVIDFSERLKVLEEIIKITEDSNKKEGNSNHLYVLNYNASYGHVQCYNTSITLSDSIGKTLPFDNYESYHHNLLKHFRNRHDDIFRNLKKVKTEYLHFALLKTNVDTLFHNEDRYKNLLTKVFKNKKVKIHAYKKSSQAEFKYEDIQDKDDVFTLPFDNDFGTLTDSEKEKIFVEKLVKNNADRLKELIDKNVNICYLDYVPFQFFVTSPKKIEVGVSRQLCLIIFTNILSVQNNNSKTISFKSESPELIQNLIDIHESFSSKYTREMNEKEKFAKLFNVNENKVNFVIKRIPDESKDRKEHDFLAYLSDIDCYSDLKEMFGSKGLALDLLYDDDLMKQNNILDNNKKTYVVIGLFENQVTDSINNASNESGIFGIKRYFKIWRDEFAQPDNSGFKIEDISIAELNNDGKPIDEKEWKVYQKNDDYEYGLIAKINLANQNTIIICGGLTSYGTKIMGNFLKNN